MTARRSRRANPSEETTVKTVRAPVVPLDQITETLRAERLVNDVRTFDTSDYIHGLMVEVDIPANCSEHLVSVVRKLGLYIESVDHFGDSETIRLRRVSRLLERMDSELERYPEHPSEGRTT